MPEKFFELTLSQAVRDAQNDAYGRSWIAGEATAEDVLGPEEKEFIAARDSFYLADVSESGWPYIQHRGGPPGFLQVFGPAPTRLRRPARQPPDADHGQSGGQRPGGAVPHGLPAALAAENHGPCARGAVREVPELAALFDLSGRESGAERLFVIDVVGFDWNCPKYITPRYTAAEVQEAVAPLRERIAELEARLKTAAAR